MPRNGDETSVMLLTLRRTCTGGTHSKDRLLHHHPLRPQRREPVTGTAVKTKATSRTVAIVGTRGIGEGAVVEEEVKGGTRSGSGALLGSAAAVRSDAESHEAAHVPVHSSQSGRQRTGTGPRLAPQRPKAPRAVKDLRLALQSPKALRQRPQRSLIHALAAHTVIMRVGRSRRILPRAIWLHHRLKWDLPDTIMRHHR